MRERIGAKCKAPAGAFRLAAETIFDSDLEVDVDNLADDVAWFLGH